MSKASNKPLHGLKVLDFSRVLAGPLCTQSLADMGADVMKIEPPRVGDETRGWPPLRAPGFGAVFLAVNRNKRSLAVDLKDDAGKKIIHRLAEHCDVVVENFSTGVAERLSIGERQLRAINRRLIYCSISGYGRSGPLKQSAGYDVILQAFSGMMSITGTPDSGHIRIPISPIDHVTGVNAVSAILAGLIQRGATGVGAHLEVSLLDTAMSLLNYSMQSYWERGTQPARWGSSHEALCPYQAFEAADGPVMIGVANDSLWQKFCVIADLPDMALDTRFSMARGRAEHRVAVLERVQAAVRLRPVSFWVGQLTNAGVPVSAIHSFEQVLAHPQTAARGMVLQYSAGDSRDLKGIAYPVIFDAQPRELGRAPPALGEHSEEILAEFGWSKEQIAGLKSAGTIVSSAG